MSNQSKLIFKDSFRGDEDLEKLLRTLTISPDSPANSPSKATKPTKEPPQTGPQPWILSFDDEDILVYPPTGSETLPKGKSKPRLSSGSSQLDDPEINYYIANTELRGKSYVSLSVSQS